MAQITKSILEMHRLAALLVPADILKSISQDELVDRVAEADRLGRRAADPTLSGDLRTAYKMRAQAVLAARPRDAVAREHAALIAKAAQLPNAQAEAVREHARRLIEEDQPPAPRHQAAVAKAKTDPADITAVFDADGQLIGVVDTDLITVVSGPGAAAATRMADPATAAPDTAGGQQVSKAVRAFDQHGRMFVTDQKNIRKTASLQTSAEVGQAYKRKVLGQARPADKEGDDHGRGTDAARGGYIDPPDVQARRGSVMGGGTTGAGKPRKLDETAASLAAASQATLPGDVPDRAVIKALNPGWTAVHDWQGVLVGAVKQANIIAAPRPGTVAKSRIDHSHANVYDASRRKIGMAPLSHILPVADLRKAIGTTVPGRRAGR